MGVPFEKGKSGNPGGRPKGFASRVRELVGVDSIVKFALEMMRNTEVPPRDRLAAAVFLTDRGWGKPSQTITHEGSVGGVLVLNSGDMATAEDWIKAHGDTTVPVAPHDEDKTKP
jgi:hypothetical protein